jgi:hypothetical protein
MTRLEPALNAWITDSYGTNRWIPHDIALPAALQKQGDQLPNIKRTNPMIYFRVICRFQAAKAREQGSFAVASNATRASRLPHQ